jgi:hypothetical protein
MLRIRASGVTADMLARAAERQAHLAVVVSVVGGRVQFADDRHQPDCVRSRVQRARRWALVVDGRTPGLLAAPGFGVLWYRCGVRRLESDIARLLVLAKAHALHRSSTSPPARTDDRRAAAGAN